MSRSKHARNTTAAITFRREEGQRKAEAVEAAVIELKRRAQKTGETFGVQDVADRAKVSRAFIYAHPKLRASIALNDANDNAQHAPPPLSPTAPDTKAEDTHLLGSNATIASLGRRINALESTVKSLDERLASVITQRNEWKVERDALYARLARLTDGK